MFEPEPVGPPIDLEPPIAGFRSDDKTEVMIFSENEASPLAEMILPANFDFAGLPQDNINGLTAFLSEGVDDSQSALTYDMSKVDRLIDLDDGALPGGFYFPADNSEYALVADIMEINAVKLM